MKEQTKDAELMDRALTLLAQTRATMARELTSRKDDIEQGRARSLSWTDLAREIADMPWS